MGVSENLIEVESQKKEFCLKAGVPPETVRLIAVSKTVPSKCIKEAYECGVRMFGENRVQEYLKKREDLPKDIYWNIIGQLQTNKVKYIIGQGVFLLHSLDRLSLANALQAECLKHNTQIDALVELNLSKEDTKSGLYEEDLDSFIDAALNLDRINIRGFMTIGPLFGNETETRTVFARAKKIFDRTKSQIPDITYLSMGMSNDFGWAILEGSNMIRVGTSIFGRRA